MSWICTDAIPDTCTKTETHCHNAHVQVLVLWRGTVRAILSGMTITEIVYDKSNARNPGWGFITRTKGQITDYGPIDSLDDLFEVLQIDWDELVVYARSGEPAEHRGDLSNLPNFGGEEPEDTFAVWSWDEKRLLVGTCRTGFEIINREDA